MGKISETLPGGRRGDRFRRVRKADTPHWFVVQPLGKGKRKGTGQSRRLETTGPGGPLKQNLESAAELMKIEEKYWSGNSSSVALSERAAYSYQDPGFRFASASLPLRFRFASASLPLRFRFASASLYYAFGVLGVASKDSSNCEHVRFFAANDPFAPKWFPRFCR